MSSRREFLKFVAGLGFSAAALAPVGRALAGLVDPEVPRGMEVCPYQKIDTPPSLMLHRANLKYFPDLIPALSKRYSSFMTYRDLWQNISDCKPIDTENTCILSLDDPSSKYLNPEYLEMVDQVIEAGMSITLGLVTNGTREQASKKIWDDLIKRTKSGQVEIALHTEGHLNLPRLSDEDLEYQIEECHQEIQEHTGQAPVTLILPFGNGYDYDTDVIEPRIEKVCADLGINMIVGIRGGREIALEDRVHLVGRVPPNADSNVTVQWLDRWFGGSGNQ